MQIVTLTYFILPKKPHTFINITTDFIKKKVYEVLVSSTSEVLGNTPTVAETNIPNFYFSLKSSNFIIGSKYW